VKLSALTASGNLGLAVALFAMMGLGAGLSAENSFSAPSPDAGLAATGPADSRTAPSYADIVRESEEAGRPAPSPLAYRLVLRYASPAVLESPGLFEKLLGEADRALRFGASAQETGLRLRREAQLATRSRQGPLTEGMMRLLREEERRSFLYGSPFGGPERGAGRLIGNFDNFIGTLGAGSVIGTGGWASGGGSTGLPIGSGSGGGKGQ